MKLNKKKNTPYLAITLALCSLEDFALFQVPDIFGYKLESKSIKSYDLYEILSIVVAVQTGASFL